MSEQIPDPDVVGARYREVEAPVRGGTLHAAVWEPIEGAEDAPTVLTIHGITSSHMAWPEVAALLPRVRVVAPDLRGRGRSRDLPAPYGMPSHADDVADLLKHLGIPFASVVGHSMGAFVAVVLADRHPDMVHSLVLIDGGMPLMPPAGVAPEQMAAAVLGPAADRLNMTFADRGAYREFWREHPAMGPYWSDLTGAYVDYDVVGEEPELRAATRVEALEEDIRELVDGDSLLRGLERLRHPTAWVLAPRGLQDEIPPLYPQAAREHWIKRFPQVSVSEIDDVNHYTIVMGSGGAAALEKTIRAALV
ncbi:alpha/beta hydrolase [Ornithinimicrobium sp. Arc0846-15]|nr:alpha/beta hydrolase [Ornithinimicrobium laminariae]